ncbi:hypothetical protein EDC56_0130 [Sinobacterium caligoides]|uniref:Amphi-Trp domain-containing protein n=1 Tax=Sinobacterium caligoides TaxID=933926 RepID=A0A3N2DXV2_9GAMM|nr:hypothetical protein [Sinobacterium caligoides]ROS04624.1 hypothetical protein EDC56_0130 [Sinobacterium caligoides]
MPKAPKSHHHIGSPKRHKPHHHAAAGHHKHRPPHHVEWLFNIHNEELTSHQIGEYIKSIGSKIQEEGRVNINNNEVVLPNENIELIIRHERAPRGELVFKLEMKWINSTESTELDANESINIS